MNTQELRRAVARFASKSPYVPAVIERKEDGHSGDDHMGIALLSQGSSKRHRLLIDDDALEAYTVLLAHGWTLADLAGVASEPPEEVEMDTLDRIEAEIASEVIAESPRSGPTPIDVSVQLRHLAEQVYSIRRLSPSDNTMRLIADEIRSLSLVLEFCAPPDPTWLAETLARIANRVPPQHIGSLVQDKLRELSREVRRMEL